MLKPQRRALLIGSGATAALSTIAGWLPPTRTQAATALPNGQATGQPTPPRAPMPTLFIGHGSPMNALRDNDFTRCLRQWGAALPRPTAILSVSAHWLTPGVTAVGIQMQPRTIHDFRGFPPELEAIQYPAPGAPELARAAAAEIRQTQVLTTDEWGLDHGTWTVLRHLFPEADIPVFQLSIDYDQPGAYHLALGRELAALRERGVLILGSGNIVHNLRATDRDAADGLQASRPWAAAFDQAAADALAQRDDDRLADYASLSIAARMAVPTPDHYYPLLYALGAASPATPPQTVFEGFQAGTLSMRCLQFGTS